MRRLLVPLTLLAVLLPAAGCSESGGSRVSASLLPDGVIRAPDTKTDQDTNPANLASAVITYSFGQLPEYIDEAAFRLLPHDVEQPSVPGKTTRRVYDITVPQTNLVLDTVYTAAPARQEARQLARAWTVDVALDGRHVADPERYWVYYRNNGPQICRIYFPGDLASLQLAANSMVFHPLSPGRHRLLVSLVQRLTPTLEPAKLVADYRLTVLDRAPNAKERAIAPDEDGPPPPTNRTPLAFRTQSS